MWTIQPQPFNFIYIFSLNSLQFRLILPSPLVRWQHQPMTLVEAPGFVLLMLSCLVNFVQVYLCLKITFPIFHFSFCLLYLAFWVAEDRPGPSQIRRDIRTIKSILILYIILLLYYIILYYIILYYTNIIYYIILY